MNFHRAALLVLTTLLFASHAAHAEEEASIEIIPRDTNSLILGSITDRAVTFTNGLTILFNHPTYGRGVLIADQAEVNQITGDVVAKGHVRIQRDDLVWVGDQINYNINTRKIEAVQFRAGGALPGAPPVFVAGENVGGDYSNNVYTAENALVTTDDIENPTTHIKASSITIAPGKYIKARNAVVYVEGFPIFYFPFYTQRLDGKLNRFDFVPGYRSRYGAYLLSGYNWVYDEHLDGKVHADYRSKRGFGGGLDFGVHLKPWGETTLRYYQLHDEAPETDNEGYDIPADRNRLALTYDAEPVTNLTFKSQIRYQSDERIIHNFFESEYRANPQPSTYLEANTHSDNFALDVLVQPRINEFFENVERLPEVRLTGFQQQVFDTPIYYETDSSVGYYRRAFAVTNDVVSGADYEAARADTFHQLSLPLTYLGWLNVIPRVGGRATYYSQATGPGATTEAGTRTVFNTGAEVTFKAAQTWADQTNGLFALDGLRHIFQPSVNYAFVPEPSLVPAQLPQFDYELPSLRLLPLNFPEYNDIDSVDSQNTLRLGLCNRLQTKRDGVVQDFVYWNVYTDCRLDPSQDQSTFSDLFSDLIFRPRSWLIMESLTRFDMENGVFQLAFNNLTLAPNDRWSWSIGHIYLRQDFSPDPAAWGAGNNALTSVLFLRMNENWGFRAAQQYQVSDNWLQQQTYSVYRDFRNWTGALTFRVRDPRTSEGKDYSVAFTFSLKAFPRTSLGEDAVHPTGLLGY